MASPRPRGCNARHSRSPRAPCASRLPLATTRSAISGAERPARSRCVSPIIGFAAPADVCCRPRTPSGAGTLGPHPLKSRSRSGCSRSARRLSCLTFLAGLAVWPATSQHAMDSSCVRYRRVPQGRPRVARRNTPDRSEVDPPWRSRSGCRNVWSLTPAARSDSRCPGNKVKPTGAETSC